MEVKPLTLYRIMHYRWNIEGGSYSGTTKMQHECGCIYDMGWAFDNINFFLSKFSYQPCPDCYNQKESSCSQWNINDLLINYRFFRPCKHKFIDVISKQVCKRCGVWRED